MCGEKPMARTMPIEAGDVFLVIDVQNDFCPGGLLPVPYGDDVVSPINRLASRFAHVVLTQDWHPRGHHSFASSHPGCKPYETIQAHYGAQTLWPDHCIQETNGAQLHADLQIPHAELILRKGFRADINSYSAFFENDRKTPTDSPAISMSAGSAVFSSPGSPSIIACVIQPRMLNTKVSRP